MSNKLDITTLGENIYLITFHYKEVITRHIFLGKRIEITHIDYIPNAKRGQAIHTKRIAIEEFGGIETNKGLISPTELRKRHLRRGNFLMIKGNRIPIMKVSKRII